MTARTLRSEYEANVALAPTITPTEHEKAEWSRMAVAAYSANRNDVGHRYSAAASLPRGSIIPVNRFDNLQHGYRAWLCWNELP